MLCCSPALLLEAQLFLSTANLRIAIAVPLAAIPRSSLPLLCVTKQSYSPALHVLAMRGCSFAAHWPAFPPQLCSRLCASLAVLFLAVSSIPFRRITILAFQPQLCSRRCDSKQCSSISARHCAVPLPLLAELYAAFPTLCASVLCHCRAIRGVAFPRMTLQIWAFPLLCYAS